MLIRPMDLRRILEDTCPCNAGTDAAPYVDSWEKGLARVAKEMKTVEDSKVVAAAIARKPDRSAHFNARPGDRRPDTSWKGGGRGWHEFGRSNQKERGARGGGKPSARKTFSFKKKTFGRFGRDAEPANRDQSERTAPNGREGVRDVSTVKCFKCGRMGHYANECPEAAAPGGRKGGGGRGNGKRGNMPNGGRGAGKRE